MGLATKEALDLWSASPKQAWQTVKRGTSLGQESQVSHTLSTTKSMLRLKAQGKEKSEGERGGREEELPIVETECH